MLLVRTGSKVCVEARARNRWQSISVGPSAAGACFWPIAGAAVSERRDRRRHARGYVREWTSAVAVSSQIGPSSQIRLARRESVGLDRGPSCSGCGCGGCCIGHRRLQRAEVDSGVSTGATQWPPAGRTAARLPHLTGMMISLECSVSPNRRSGSDGPRPRVSAGVGAPACSRECMCRAHRREWGLIVK